VSARVLKAGSMCLYSWCGVNFFLSCLILVIVVFGFGDSPLLAMVFEEPEIAGFGAGAILALNCLTILYNSYAVARLSRVPWNFGGGPMIIRRRSRSHLDAWG